MDHQANPQLHGAGYDRPFADYQPPPQVDNGGNDNGEQQPPQGDRRPLRLYEATYLAVAEVVAPTVARWTRGDACYRISVNRAFEHTGQGPDFSIQNIQDNHLSEALGRYPDTITKETPWKQAIRHHSHTLAHEILPFLERSRELSRHAVDIEVRSHSIRHNRPLPHLPAAAHPFRPARRGRRNQPPHPRAQRPPNVVADLLHDMSSKFSVTVHRNFEPIGQRTHHTSNSEKFTGYFKNFDIVLVRFNDPRDQVAQRTVQAIGMIHNIEGSNSFRIALCAIHPKDLPAAHQPRADAQSNRDSKLWLFMTEEQRTAFMPIDVPIFEADGTARIARRSGNQMMGKLRGKMERIGSLSELIYSLRSLSSPSSSVGQIVKSNKYRPDYPMLPAFFLTTVEQWLVEKVPTTKQISSEHRSQFIRQLCTLIDSRKTLDMLRGVAGSGKTSYLIAMCAVMAFLHEKAHDANAVHHFNLNAQGIENAEDNFSITLPNGLLWDLSFLATVKVFFLTDTNAGFNDTSYRLVHTFKSAGLDKSLFVQTPIIEHLSSLTQDSNIVTRAFKLYRHMLPYDLGAHQGEMATVSETLAMLQNDIDQELANRRMRSNRERGGGDATNLPEIMDAIEFDDLKADRDRASARLTELSLLCELMQNALGERSETAIVEKPAYKPLLMHAANFTLDASKVFAKKYDVVTQQWKKDYVDRTVLSLPHWTGAIIEEFSDKMVFTRADGSKTERSVDIPYGVNLGFFKAGQSPFIACTTGYFLTTWASEVLPDNTILLDDESARHHKYVLAALANSAHSMICAGDPAQQGPYMVYRPADVFTSPDDIRRSYGTSYMEDALNIPPVAAKVSTLLYTKRCHPILANAASAAFYENAMIPHPRLTQIRRGIAYRSYGPLCPFVMVNVVSPTCIALPPDPPSPSNPIEARILVKWTYRIFKLELQLIDEERQSLSDFFALSPYNMQIAAMDRLVEQVHPYLTKPVSATTVAFDQHGRTDIAQSYIPWNSSTFATCQGLEKSFAMISLTRSRLRENGTLNDKYGIIDLKSVSTALTRGMRGAVLIGDIEFHKSAVSHGAAMAKLQEYAVRQRSYFEVRDDRDVDVIFDNIHRELGLPM